MEVLTKVRNGSASAVSKTGVADTECEQEDQQMGGGERKVDAYPEHEVTEEGGNDIPEASADGQGEGREKSSGNRDNEGGLVSHFPTAIRRLSWVKTDGSGKSREQQVGLISEYETAVLIAISHGAEPVWRRTFVPEKFFLCEGCILLWYGRRPLLLPRICLHSRCLMPNECRSVFSS